MHDLLDVKTPKEISLIIVNNVRLLRKKKNISQKELSLRSGVSLGSIKRFERTGEISLIFLLKIAVVLDCETDFTKLFTAKHYNSIQEFINDTL